MKYNKHVFICTNQKAEGKKCCGEERGMELVRLFKEKIKERGISFPIRAQRAGCFDVCAFGPAVVVYPEGTFYGHVTPSDVDEIIDSHLIGNQPVERLILPF